MDFAAEGFFDGLDDEAREERRALLTGWSPRASRDDGAAPRPAARGLLVFLAAEREVGGEPKYTSAQIAELSGADPVLLAALRRAHGLPLPEADAVELPTSTSRARDLRGFSARPDRRADGRHHAGARPLAGHRRRGDARA